MTHTQRRRPRPRTRLRRNTGSGTLGIAALLGVLAVAAVLGAWNVHRNLAKEEQVFRPYRGVSEAELTQLAEAYRAEAQRAQSHWDEARKGSGRVRDHQLLDERLVEFERVRRRSERTRNLGAKSAELDATLAAIEQEQQLRANEAQGVARFLRLLLTI